jgi:hypothetical protein
MVGGWRCEVGGKVRLIWNGGLRIDGRRKAHGARRKVMISNCELRISNLKTRSQGTV